MYWRERQATDMDDDTINVDNVIGIDVKRLIGIKIDWNMLFFFVVRFFMVHITCVCVCDMIPYVKWIKDDFLVKKNVSLKK